MIDHTSVLSVRRQSELYDRMLRKRLDEILPEAMRRAGLDMWLVICQEDDHDPVFNTMIRYRTWAPILQMLIFIRSTDGSAVRRLNLSRTDMGDLYEKIWEGKNDSEQWQKLAALVAELDPQRIGINIGSVQWSAGGLTHNLYQQLLQSLPQQYHTRLVSAEVAATYWGMTLCDEEVHAYPHIVSLTKDIIADCYSAKKVISGYTTSDDLQWNFWQHVSDFGLRNSFAPFFNVVRSEKMRSIYPLDDRIIRPGDLIHCDVGLRYLDLCSDLQEWAYVRLPGEERVPDGIHNLLVEVNRLQQVFMSEFKAGLDGNTLLHNILSKAKAKGISGPRVYSHSLGHYLHEPGPLIGLPWEQERNPGRGDVALDYNTVFTMELSIDGVVPEWGGQVVRFSEEQDVCFTGQGCLPLVPLQKEFHII